MVRRSEPSEALRAEGLRQTPVQQTKWSCRPIIQLRAEPFEACPHETDPSFDFEREISAFVDDAAKVRTRPGSSVYISGQLLICIVPFWGSYSEPKGNSS